MKIIDLVPEYESQFFCCLEEGEAVMNDAGKHKACWYNVMKNKGLRVKLAQGEDGLIKGMIQYVPAEYSHIEGKNLYVVLCIWVPGHKNKKSASYEPGMGKALLKAAEEDVRNIGAKGLVTWGVWLPFFMKASWFRKQGYRVVDKLGMMRLLWKPFSDDAIPPRFFRHKRKPEISPDKLTISLFKNGWCPAQNAVYERTKKAAAGYEDRVEMKEYDTLDDTVRNEWGIVDAIFIDSEEITSGPPLSYEKIRRMVDRKVKRYR